VTIHDLPPLRFRDEGTMPRSAAAGARRARRVICPSRFAADEVEELLQVPASKIRVIPNGVDEIFFDVDIEAPSVTPSGPFVLHAAGATERKNLAALADAWRIVSAQHPALTLVLAGPPDDRRTKLFADLPGTRLAGRLAPRDIAGLMRRAELVVIPSRYEGFGLPALEAMAAGCPVVSADTGALPEVCGDAAIMVAPDADAIAAGMERALTDSSERTRLAEAGPRRAREFSWTTSARQHLDVYREASG
jgi:glycosyltransferase involved in cell wall biosynthesis